MNNVNAQIERPSPFPFLACTTSALGSTVVSVLVAAGVIGIGAIPVVGQAILIAGLAVWFFASLGGAAAVCYAERAEEFPEVQIEGKLEFPGEVEMMPLARKCLFPLSTCFSEREGENVELTLYAVRLKKGLSFAQLHEFANPF